MSFGLSEMDLSIELEIGAWMRYQDSEVEDLPAMRLSCGWLSRSLPENAMRFPSESRPVLEPAWQLQLSKAPLLKLIPS